MRTSGKFSAAARTLTSTWPGPGVGCSTSSKLRTFECSPSSCTRHARMPATMPDARTAVTWWSEPFANALPVAVADGLVAHDGDPRGERQDGQAPDHRRARRGHRDRAADDERRSAQQQQVERVEDAADLVVQGVDRRDVER